MLLDIFLWLVIGAVAGWIAGQIMRGAGFGVLGNMILGIIGAIMGGLVFGLLGLSADNLIGSLITATVGAIILLFLAGFLRRT